ncbi:Cyclic nucleotide-binding protein [Hyella patelloides LEGE 07179]|uniref:Cyclic nucleotide-binding protein n=1 Tax=Hyella patelloides LEGE 07179 TaxID=945734 RepID=A0A563VVM7_9CYAN|nr:cyclic nucleotide-binding domain-containing protein [Hyella patelloides]VEP15466.1 Cyclic nucleotide-binding protein [Hyella patelloides LEGE 07179]
MTEVLLKQLNSQDLQWLKLNGERQYINSGESLIQQKETVECLYIILNGEFVGIISRQSEGVLGRAFSALEDDSNLEREIIRLGEGEIIGEMSFLDISPAANTFTAVEDSLVLGISREKLQKKLKQDVGFAARFYRAIAILLSERFEHLVNLYLRNRMGKLKPLQDIPMLFGEFKDSDVDWMLSCGFLQKVPPGQTLAQVGRQAENLYIILRGKMSLIVNEAKQNQISKVFVALELEEDSQAELEREIAQLTCGEIVGETATFDSHLSGVTLRTEEDTIVLTIPKEKLLVKLQQDPAMAARFYRAIAILLSGRLQGLISRLGFGKDSYQFGQTLSSETEYEDEIELSIMDKIFLGGARFDWMLKRLGVI